MRPLARPRSLPALVVTIIVMSADVLEDDVLYLPGFADQSIHKRVLPTAEVQTPCDDCSMNTAAPSQARSAGNARGVIVLFDHMDRLGREHSWYSFSHPRFRWGIRRKLDNIADGKRANLEGTSGKHLSIIPNEFFCVVGITRKDSASHESPIDVH